MLAVLAAVTVLAAVPAPAQDWTVVDDDWCKRSGSKLCEIREITIDGRDDIAVRSINGSIEVEVWDRDEIRVRARIQVSGGKSSAREIMEDIEILTGDEIRATGPKRGKGGFLGMFKGRGWSVSYRLMVPRDMAVDVKTTNGSIEVSGVNGDIRFDTTNGGVKLHNMGGDIDGGTTNGGVLVSLSPDWDGSEVRLHSTNGGIKVDLPHDFSARLDLATTNGGIRVEHPVKIDSKKRNRLKGTIGDGGSVLLKARTTNGGVTLRRADA